MPVLHKIDESTFNVTTQVVKRTKNCLPVVEVLDGNKVQISDEYNVLVPRGMYTHMVFVPDAMLGEVRWNRAFNRYRMQRYDQMVVNNGVLFLFDKAVDNGK